MGTGTYWTSDGRYQREYIFAFNQLVPNEGKADTYHGEVLRTLSRIYYDRFNNGGWNTSRKQLRFLMEWASEHMRSEVLAAIITRIHEETVTDEEFEQLADAVIKWAYDTAVSSTPTGDYQI